MLARASTIVLPAQYRAAGFTLNRSDPINRKIHNAVAISRGGNSFDQGVRLPVVLASSPTFPRTKYGRGLLTSGGSTLQIPSNGVDFAAADFAIQLLFSPVTWTSGFSSLLSKASLALEFFFDTSGNASYYYWAGGGGTPTAPTGFTTDKLHQLVISRSGTTVTWYANGSSAGTHTISGAAGGTGNLYLANNLGGGGSSPSINAYLVRTWTRDLSLQEVKRLAGSPYLGFSTPYAISADPDVPAAPPPGAYWGGFKTIQQPGGNVGFRLRG
jgi:hypothetical protein